jgi:hypothetical protein
VNKPWLEQLNPAAMEVGIPQVEAAESDDMGL